jgi:uncharacterized membrane protein YgcG
MVFYLCYDLRRDSRLLNEVVLHVALEIEISELIGGSEREELGEARIRVDLAPILLVLETLLADVRVDLLGDLRAGHLGSNGLSEELGELITDASGLDESRRSSVSRRLPLLGVLLRALELAGEDLLKGLVISLHGSEERRHLLELGAELLDLNGRGGLGGGLGGGLNDDRRLRRNGNGRRRRSGSSDLLGRARLGSSNGGLNRGGGNGGGGGSSSGLLSRSNHLGDYKLYCHYCLSTLCR